MGVKTISWGKLAWIKVILVALVFTAPLFSISFSKLTLSGIQAVNASQDLLPLYGEDHSAALLSIGNYTKWSLNPSPPTGTSLITSTSKLALAGTFQPSPNPSGVSISRKFLANLTQYPIFYMQMNVSKGVSYGIRFDAQNSDGSFVAVWKDTDALNHRQGTGQPENIQANMIQVIRTNMNKTLDNLTRITVYIERVPSTEKTNFTLSMTNFEFLNYRLVPAQSRGLYHSLYLTLNLTSTNSSVSTLRSIQVEGRLDASPNTLYVIYLIDRSTIYRAGIHTYDPASPDQIYLISFPAQKLKSFPDNLPTSDPTIVIVSASGTLYLFSVKSVTLNYAPRETQATPLPPSKDPPVFYLTIFVLLPLAVAVILYDHFRRRPKKSVEPLPSVDSSRG